MNIYTIDYETTDGIDSMTIQASCMATAEQEAKRLEIAHNFEIIDIYEED